MPDEHFREFESFAYRICLGTAAPRRVARPRVWFGLRSATSLNIELEASARRADKQRRKLHSKYRILAALWYPSTIFQSEEQNPIYHAPATEFHAPSFDANLLTRFRG